ncbi:MAG: NADH-quinone oxidoreductase subunit A [Planctomycetota bacterium]|nr:NADH-quinone oxidoreductase subunit A [Planctomycetota bacterium]
MDNLLVPLLLFAACATLLSVGVLTLSCLLGPKKTGRVKEMPYESGMDPIHDARRRFDVRFHLVAIAFLLFDVELLFLYPWAVANKNPDGLRSIAKVAPDFSPTVVFAEVMFFIVLLTVGFAYAWRKGVFRWR